MSNFFCDKCGAACLDSETGYYTGCKHYPPDREPTEAEQGEIDNAGIWSKEDIDNVGIWSKEDDK